MAKIEWKQYGCGTIQNDFSQAETQKFIDDNFTHVTREAIQNVVDHPKNEKEPHVRVVFQMFELEREAVYDKLDFSTLLKRVKGTIALANRCGNGDREVVPDCRRQEKILQNNVFRFLKISDYGTTGVDGAQVYDPGAFDGRNNFKAMVFDLGGGQQSSSGAGGHGLGKLANVASSQLNTVFFNTVSSGGSLCAGVSINYQTQDENGKNLEKMASFVKRENPKGYDVEEVITFLNQEEAASLNADLFSRTEIGTDVIIVEPKIIGGDEPEWKDKILANCIIHFPVAILEGSLEVTVGDTELNAANIEQIVQSLAPAFPTSMKKELEKTIEFIKAYRQEGGSEHSKKYAATLEGFGEVELYLYKDADVDANQVAFFRKQGMSLQSYKSYAYQSNYAGVLIVRGEEGNVFLRSIELADHRSFGGRSSLDQISDQEVKNRRNRLNDWIDSKVEEFTKIEARGCLALKGLDKFIFIPAGANDGDETDDLGTKLQDPVRKASSSASEKKKKVVSEKLKVEESETGEEGEIYVHVRRSPRPKPIGPNPVPPGQGPKPTIVSENPTSKYNGRMVSKGIGLKDGILSAGSKVTYISFEAKPGVEKFNLGLKAVGEDDTESDAVPNIRNAVDTKTGVVLTVADGVICDIENDGPKVIKIEFDKDPESRLDIIPFIDVPAPTGYKEPTSDEEEDESNE